MISRIIDALQTLQDEQAHSALKTPKGDTAFHYGHAAGVYQGLQMALNAINALSQDQEDEDHGTQRRGGHTYLRT